MELPITTFGFIDTAAAPLEILSTCLLLVVI